MPLLLHVALLVSSFVIVPFVAEIFVLLCMEIALSWLKFGTKLRLVYITHISLLLSFAFASCFWFYFKDFRWLVLFICGSLFIYVLKSTFFGSLSFFVRQPLTVIYYAYLP